VKKLIISLSVSIFIFTLFYFLIEENIVQLKGTNIRNIIGESVENEYIEKVNIAANNFKRFASIEAKKLDFLLENINISSVLSNSKNENGKLRLYDFINSNPYCRKIRIINKDHRIVYSTNRDDVINSKLTGKVYEEVIQKSASKGSSLLADPIIKNFIFFKSIKSEGNVFLVIFYYTEDILDNVFKRVNVINYRSFLITHYNVLLLNFPEVDSSNEENLSQLVNRIKSNESGALKVKSKEYDKSLYYKKIKNGFGEWIIGLTIDAERIKVSLTGTILLVIQAIVVFSVLIFIIISIRSKRLVAGRREKEKPEEYPKEVKIIEEVKEEVYTLGIKHEAEEVKENEMVPESGVVSLDEVEEIPEVEEIGEAELAEEIESVEEESVEEESVEEESVQEESVQEKSNEEQDEEARKPESLEKAEENEGGYLSREEDHSEEVKTHGEDVEEALPIEFEEDHNKEVIERGESFNSNLIDKSSYYNKDQIRLSSEVSERGLEEPIIDDISMMGKSEGGAGGGIPQLDKLVEASNDIEGAYDNIDEVGKTIPAIPGEFHEEKKKIRLDNELSYLIKEIEDREEKKTDYEKVKSSLNSIFKQFISELQIKRSAILVRNNNGIFLPIDLNGLNAETRERLFFTGNERIFKNILKNGKKLFVTEKVFSNSELKEKFSSHDSDKIVSIFLDPILRDDKVFAIIVVCLGAEEVKNSDTIINGLNKLKLKIDDAL